MLSDFGMFVMYFDTANIKVDGWLMVDTPFYLSMVKRNQMFCLLL